MRWTIRGIDQEMAEAVRVVARETECTLGQVVTRCVDIALHEARLQLLQAGTPGAETEDLYCLELIMADLGQSSVTRK